MAFLRFIGHTFSVYYPINKYLMFYVHKQIFNIRKFY
nr:MAG TPA: hypothetical protein [Caudoviricetes sp.]